jgi:hypothetical protein
MTIVQDSNNGAPRKTFHNSPHWLLKGILWKIDLSLPILLRIQPLRLFRQGIGSEYLLREMLDVKISMKRRNKISLVPLKKLIVK